MGNEFGVVFRTALATLSEFIYFLFYCLVSVEIIECCFHQEKSGFEPCASGRIGRMRRTGKESFNMTTGCN